MRAVRPAHLPRRAGLTTENVAHRFAVEWENDGGSHTAVYVPRRDTSSRITAALGASIFPGAYHYARFDVSESADTIRIRVRSRDHAVSLDVAAVLAPTFNSDLFASLDEAISFFRNGAVGFSPSLRHGILDGVRLHGSTWAARPMTISTITSSMCDDAAVFPDGSCAFDSAMLMTSITARWTAEPAGAAAIGLAA